MDGITDRAGEKLKGVLDGAKAAPEQCVRVEVTLAQGGTLRIDKERPGERAEDTSLLTRTPPCLTL